MLPYFALSSFIPLNLYVKSVLVNAGSCLSWRIIREILGRVDVQKGSSCKNSHVLFSATFKVYAHLLPVVLVQSPVPMLRQLLYQISHTSGSGA